MKGKSVRQLRTIRDGRGAVDSQAGDGAIVGALHVACICMQVPHAGCAIC